MFSVIKFLVGILYISSCFLECTHAGVGPKVVFAMFIIWANKQDDREVRNMTAYLCEITLYHCNCISIKQSIMACALQTGHIPIALRH